MTQFIISHNPGRKITKLRSKMGMSPHPVAVGSCPHNLKKEIYTLIPI
jgi:hypothetical protein